MLIASSFGRMIMSPFEAMKTALQEASKGATQVSPNPLVGAVLLDAEGNFVSSGYHEYYGGPHAEVNALKNVPTDKLKNATMYVTLEPCAHEGKTPSCAKMLAKLPLKKVIYGLTDPNPLVAGQGAEILKAAGIETENFSETHPEFKADLEEICEIFLWNFREKKVFVSLKIAQSLDGQVALKSGESKWITNDKSREHAHYLRAIHDATLVGRRTLQADNPSLNIRHPTINKKNKVVIIDPNGSLLTEASNLNLTKVHAPENIFWCVGEHNLEIDKVPFAKILKIKEADSGEFDLNHLLAVLWQEGLRSVMIEGGAATASQFLKAGLVNRLYLFQAPVILGAGGSRSWTETLSIHEMNKKLVVSNPKVMKFDADTLLTGRLS